MLKPITGQTGIIGILGHPIQHTFSPLMHNAVFEALGLDYRYLAFDVRPELLGKAVAGLRALQLVGVNVTVPHKEKVLRYLDHISPEARRIGAVNTIVCRDESLSGYNTDGAGFTRAFQEHFGMPVMDKRVLLLGAGGAARAVAMQLVSEGVSELIVANRTDARARRLVQAIGEHFPKVSARAIGLQTGLLEEVCGRTDILIHATSNHWEGDSLPFRASALRRSMAICDLIYNPSVTGLTRMASEAGCRVMNGAGMLLHQGALSLELWVGQKPPLDVMRSALEKAF